MQTMQAALWVVAVLVALAIAFDFMNGFRDAANSIATVVSTGVLKPGHAVLFAAFFNLIAIFVFHLSVAATVGKGIVRPGVVDVNVVLGALIGAISWNLVTCYYGIPNSSSHALIAGIAGAVIAKAGTGALLAAGIPKTVAFIFVSPILGFTLGPLMTVVVAWAFLCSTPSRVDRWFRRLQLVSAGAYSLGHGGNEAQKTIGIIWMLLIATGYATAGDKAPPAWTIVSCYAAIVLGTMFGGWRIVKTMARKSPSSSRSAASAPRRVGADAVHRHRARHPGMDHAHHHGRDRRRRRHAARQRGALGCGRHHRLGLDLHRPGFGLRRGAGLLDQSSALQIAIVLIAPCAGGTRVETRFH